MAQRKPRSGVARGPRGAQAAARRLRTAAGRGALRWVAGAARGAKRRPFAASGHDTVRGSGGVLFESSSVARQPDTPRFITPLAGVSVFTDADLSPSTRSIVDTGGAACGYHLLVVNGYTETKRVISTGLAIRSRPFIVGGRRWCVDVLPNGFNSNCADYISLFAVLLDGNAAKEVEVWFRFSFINEVERQDITVIRASNTSNFSNSVANRCGEIRFIKRDVFEQSKNLKDDSFTIRFDIMLRQDLNTEDTRIPEVPLSGIGQHFNHLLQTKVGADVTFEVSGETFSAHRCVLAARSTVFMAQLFGSMKEGTEVDVIQVKDMKAEVFKALVSFIYTDAFPEITAEAAKATGFVIWLQWLEDLIVAADKYDLQRLRFHCEELLFEVIDEMTVPKLLDLAVKHHSHRLKEECLQFLQVQSSSTLQALMATNAWIYISRAHPYLLNELIAKIAAKCNASDNAPLPYGVVEPTAGFCEEMPTQRCVVPAESNFSN